MDPERLPSARTPGLISKLLVRIAGADLGLMSRCPPGDWDYVHATGAVMCFTAMYLTGLFFALGHRLFLVPWPVMVGASAFLGCFIILIEIQLVLRPSWFQHGVAVLRIGGLELDKAVDKSGQLWIAIGIRSAMALAFAQLSALAVGLIVFGPDIQARNQRAWSQDNARLVAEVTRQVDARIAEAGQLVDTQRKRLDDISGQVTAIRQNEIDPGANDLEAKQAQAEITRLVDEKAAADQEVSAAETFSANELGGIKGSAENSGHAGNGPKRRAALERVAEARDHARSVETSLSAARARLASLRQRLASDNVAARQQAKAQLPEFEKRLADETARFTQLRDQLTKLTEDRETAITKALEASPGYVPRNDGLLGQLAALDAIAHENPRVAALILIVDVASLCLELGAVASRSLVFVPTVYAGLVARQFYENAVNTVEDMMVGLRPDPARTGPASPGARPANDNGRPGSNSLGSIFGGADDQPPQPPKRPRGRPRKNTLN